MKKFLLLQLLSFSFFNVFAQDPCDDLIIEGITLNGFDMDFITIEVTNNSMDIFDYPGFRIYNAITDELIGEEVVNFFGIANYSVHQVPHNLGEVIFDQSFPLRLELWRGFYTSIACNFEGEYVLRPSSTCFDVTVGVNLIDNTQMADTIYWVLNDIEGNLVDQGELFLDPNSPFPFETICLDVDCYEIAFSTSDNEANLGYISLVSSALFMVGGSSTVLAGGEATDFQFGLFEVCEPQSISEQVMESISIYPNPGNGYLNLDPKLKNELFRIIDSQGNLILEDRINSSVLDLSDYSKGLYLLQIQGYKTSKIIIQ